MDISVTGVSTDESPVLRNLMQLYLHDHSEFDDDELDERGLYRYEHFDDYWIEPGRHPFLIRVDGHLAGFALVRDSTSTGNGRNQLAEFFIARKYRGKGIGRVAAHCIFDMFPGEWEVGQVELNLPARKFWRSVISEYTDGEFVEIRDQEWDKGFMQVFQSRTTALDHAAE